MNDTVVNDLEFDFGDDSTVTQESYDAGSSGFKDLFDEKFNSFNPESIISGNNRLKSGAFSQEVEETPEIAFGYKKDENPLSPKRPGRFF